MSLITLLLLTYVLLLFGFVDVGVVVGIGVVDVVSCAVVIVV